MPGTSSNPGPLKRRAREVWNALPVDGSATTIERIARDAGISASTVKRGLRDLRHAKKIEVTVYRGLRGGLSISYPGRSPGLF